MSLQLQNLSSRFNTLLTQYTETYQNYIKSISSNDNSLIEMPNSSFVGQSNISVLNNSSLDDCQTTCASNSECSGATFNNTTNSCTLSSGIGNIIISTQSSAIIQQSLYYSYQLQNLNNQLLNINREMISISNNNSGNLQKTQSENKEQSTTLQTNYNTLVEERNEINKMVTEFETLNTAYENGNINVTSNYYNYIVLLFVVIFLLFVLIKYSIPEEQRGGGGGVGNDFTLNKSHFLTFGLLCCIIVFNSYIKNKQ